LHWGDYLARVEPDGTMHGMDLRPLAGRRQPEWAGADVLVEKTNTLWVGEEMDRGRDMIGVRLSDLDRRARTWPAKPPACTDLTDVGVLMRWNVQSIGCKGGLENPRGRPPPPPEIVKVLPDGSRIVKHPSLGCIRMSDKPCYNR